MGKNVNRIFFIVEFFATIKDMSVEDNPWQTNISIRFDEF